MAVDVMTPKPKEKRSALDTVAAVTKIGTDVYSMADKAGAFERRKKDLEDGKKLSDVYGAISTLDKK